MLDEDAEREEQKRQAEVLSEQRMTLTFFLIALLLFLPPLMKLVRSSCPSPLGNERISNNATYRQPVAW